MPIKTGKESPLFIDRVGEKHITRQGYEVEIVEYFDNTNATIKFTYNGNILKHKSYRNIKKGKIKNPLHKVGEKYITTEGLLIEITEWFSTNNCTIQFEIDGFVIKNRYYKSIVNGWISHPLHKSVFGVGYTGIGKYLRNGSVSRIWYGILDRCYSGKNKYPTYKDVTVCEEWHNFQNFAKWYEENYIEGWEVDKDIICPECKIYSPETCGLVPHKINSSFTDSKSYRGEYPRGVAKSNSKYTATFKRKILALKDTPEEAFAIFKIAREQHVKNLADEFKDKLDLRIYEAMYKYSININD